MKNWDDPLTLQEVILTAALDHRPARPADVREETRVTGELMRELAKEPGAFFPKLVQAVIQLTRAESSGISLLDEAGTEFVWPAVEGGLAAYLGAGTPRQFGPCGTVLDQDSPLLFGHPERHFSYLAAISPPLEEVLLVPFRIDRRPVGTIWAVIHEAGRQFDREDLRLLKNLSQFAASAYRVLANSGQLGAMFAALPRHVSNRRLTNENGKWRFEEAQ
jgi:hypothetical protein